MIDEGKPTKTTHQFPTKKRKCQASAPSDVLAWKVPLHGPGEGKEGEIKRPDAQDAADEERLEIDLATGGALADEKFGDQIGAEQKEKLDAHCSGGSEGGDGRREHGGNAHLGVEGRVVRHGVVEEDQEKRKEAEDVEFGMIEALSERAGSERVRGH